ncbi:hypothetical protein [Actinomadura macra]|uniref:hypothetical protein n=1 Tax=Actinomadura macra TaxID=46164 RepID=UPI00082EEE1F|nr:hypothetical protein [Actinomadura macra]
MTVIPGLVRRAAAEAEHQLRVGMSEGMRLLARLGRDLERSAELGRLLPSYAERIRTLEETVQSRDAELTALRTELESLVAQLNDRLLPRLDERMDDTERDLAAVATSLIRTGRDTAGNRARLDAAEQRIGDLRAKLAQTEQRAGLWRDLQATLARLGDDVDALRVRTGVRAADPPAPVPDPVPEPAQPLPAEHITDRPA